MNEKGNQIAELKGEEKEEKTFGDAKTLMAM